MNEIILFQFLTENKYPHAISQKLLLSPPSKEFFRIFEVSRSLRLKAVAIGNRLPGPAPEDKVTGTVKDNGQTQLWAQSQGCLSVSHLEERDAMFRQLGEQSQGCHSIDCLEKRDAERESQCRTQLWEQPRMSLN